MTYPVGWPDTESGAWSPPNPRGGQVAQTDVSGVSIPQAFPVLKQWSGAQAAANVATGIHAAVADTGAQQTITTGLTNPPCARTVKITPGGTTANVTAVQCTVVGTDNADQPLTEIAPAFTATEATAVETINAFKTVSELIQPACGTAVTVSYGTGNGLGLDHKLKRNTVLAAYLAGDANDLAPVKEGTAPTVAFDPAVLSKNVVHLNSALNGHSVDLYYLVP